MEPIRSLKKVSPKNVSSNSDLYFLSPEQKKFYEDNGYLVIKGLIDYTTLYACKQRFIQICKGLVDQGGIQVVKEASLVEKGLKGEDAINKVQDILYDEVFATYTEHSRLLHVVSQFIGDNMTAVHSMFINKPPGTARHPPHQDMVYFPFRPIDKVVGVWTAIDDVHVDNGCLFAIPGSHKPGEMYQHGDVPESSKFYHGILAENSVAPMDKRVNLEMGPGDTVFLHPLLVHGSGANRTQHYRKAITCHYAHSGCRYIEPAGTPHETIVEDVNREMKKKGYIGVYVDYMKVKNKVVKGPKCSL